ncbi:hypothetical protein QCA50_017757 [Cerrena zonata]|uniref:Uncharacterized protein n=1 Tax=Cerrena zonata TaxID=2478898 RepID=A0AAW0FLV9_9APHY
MIISDSSDDELPTHPSFSDISESKFKFQVRLFDPNDIERSFEIGGAIMPTDQLLLGEWTHTISFWPVMPAHLDDGVRGFKTAALGRLTTASANRLSSGICSTTASKPVIVKRRYKKDKNDEEESQRTVMKDVETSIKVKRHPVTFEVDETKEEASILLHADAFMCWVNEHIKYFIRTHGEPPFEIP